MTYENSTVGTAPVSPEAEIVTHLGIRYAALASGHRFDPPALVDLNVGIAESERFATTEEIPIFPQLASRLDTYMGTPLERPVSDENAFYLNTFAPRTGTDLPVVVFVHGGAWTSGAGTYPWYDGARMAASGICVVSVNYRVHATGLLSRADEHRPLQDLEIALDWVSENISRFGGDPANVTLVGQSAGAWYVHALSRIERLRGRFRKIALLSLPNRAPWPRSRQEAVIDELSALTGGQDPAAVAVDELLHSAIAASRTVSEKSAPPPVLGFTPAPLLAAESADLPADLLDPSRSATALTVDEVYFRYTLDETGIFLAGSNEARNATNEQVSAVFDTLITEPEQVPDHLRRRMDDEEVSPYERLRAITSWVQFQAIANALALAYRAAGKQVELHEFTASATDPALASCHCLDLPFQFGNFDDWSHAPMLQGLSQEEFSQISSSVIVELTDFVTR